MHVRRLSAFLLLFAARSPNGMKVVLQAHKASLVLAAWFLETPGGSWLAFVRFLLDSVYLWSCCSPVPFGAASVVHRCRLARYVFAKWDETWFYELTKHLWRLLHGFWRLLVDPGKLLLDF